MDLAVAEAVEDDRGGGVDMNDHINGQEVRELGGLVGGGGEAVEDEVDGGVVAIAMGLLLGGVCDRGAADEVVLVAGVK